MQDSQKKWAPETLAQYKDYVAKREDHLGDWATKSSDAVLGDGTTSDCYYQKSLVLHLGDPYLDRNRFRTLFQLDRDRILYLPYFHRLAKKTQMVMSPNVLVETRLTHTIRVVQIARSLCMGLRLNQDLA